MGNLVSISSTLIGADQPATIRAPEIEAGVGCDFDSYLLVPDNALDDRIAAANARLGQDVVILGHHYQRDEVVKFADFRGDSLKLSFQASQAEGRYIVFCGVHFMAESADILRREHQTVILPDLNAGCSMADMADIGQVEACWSELSSLLDSRKVIPVTYMNSTAAIKAFTGEQGGSVCTSSNAAGVMKWAFEKGEKVLFLPDEHLGRNTGYRMGIPLEQMIVWDPYQEFGGNTPEAIRSPCITASRRSRSSVSAASIPAFASSRIPNAASKLPRPPIKSARPRASSKSCGLLPTVPPGPPAQQ